MRRPAGDGACLLALRLSAEEEHRGADLSIHRIGANPEEDVRLGRI